MFPQRSKNTDMSLFFTVRLALIRPSLLVLFLAVAPVAFTGCAKYDPGELYSEAVVEAGSAHWDDALVTVQKALRVKANHLPSLILKGLCLYHLQRVEEAEESFREALQTGPGDFAAQYFYGWILCEEQQYDSAMPHLRKAHQIRPDHPEALALLARCSLEQSLPEGIGYFSKLRNNSTYGRGPMIDNSIALLYLSQGDFVRAKNHLLAAYRREPTHPIPAQNLAVLYDQYLSKPTDAVRFYGVALSNSQKAGDERRAAALRKRMMALARERRAEGG